MSRAAAIKSPKKAAGGSRVLLSLGLVATGLASAMFLPSSVVAGACLLPTLAALVFDQDNRKSATICVGMMNAAGTIGFLIKLWMKGHTMDVALEIVSRPETWLVAYGAAGLGWLVYYSVPSVFQIVLAQRTRARIAEVEENQVALRRLWGEEVKNRHI